MYIYTSKLYQFQAVLPRGTVEIISYWSSVTAGWKRRAIREKSQPAILQVHFPATYPKPVCKLQPFPLQYWHNELHLKLTPPHWPFWHLSDLVHFCPSSQDMPFLLVHADVVVPGWHHLRYNEKKLLLEELFGITSCFTLMRKYAIPFAPCVP